MQYKKKRDNKKPLAVALGVILALAPGAVIIDNLEPVSVHADFGDYVGIADYLEYGSSNPSDSVFNISGFAGYFAALWTAHECLNNPIVTGSGLTLSNSVSVVGKAIYQGTQIQVLGICLDGGSSSGSDTLMLATSPAFNFRVVVSHLSSDPNPYDGYSIEQNCNILTSRFNFAYIVRKQSGNPLYCNIDFIDGFGNFTDYSLARQNYVSYNFGFYFVTNTIPVYDGNPLTVQRYVKSGFDHPLAGNAVRVNIPSGDYTDFNDFVVNVLNPYYTNEYPDITPYIYSPYSPEFPDPSDAYPGIPKEWTIKNPQLPTSPSIGLNAYKPDLSEMNPSESIMEYDSGFDFWWWLTDQALTHTNTKAIIFLAILLGLVGYLLWHLGGHL